MKPDRSNYEIWLIDWLDGTLDPNRTEQFVAFLDENPDIRAEVEYLSSVRLSPGEKTFSWKNELRKSAADLTTSQVEYLSVAFLENDISQEQLADLEHSFEHNPGNHKLFDSVNKIKLVPPVSGYKHKNSLKKLTAGQKVLRISTVALGAAATVTILVMSYLFVPDYFLKRDNQAASEIIPDTTPATLNIFSHKPIIAKVEISIPKTTKSHPYNETITTIDSVPAAAITENHIVNKIIVPIKARINFDLNQNSLIASNNNFTIVDYDDDRGRFRKFIARTFREKLLRDETNSDNPIKPYEIAMAGVDGLNKLLDWKMELVETRDTVGEVKSVYFSSGLLTFNAPVRKTDQ
jgi:hypothetical protein